MKMHRFILWILIIAALSTAAQEHLVDSLHQLQTVEIQASRLSQFTAGIHVERIDSSLLQMHSTASVAALISGCTSSLVRSYGTGGLATLSFRGTQTTQSGVFWNGFNLNQPNMGMTDLSEIPAAFFDQIDIQTGGTSALYGSGMIGGSLQLGNRNVYSTPFNCTLSLSAGSFNDYSVAARTNSGNSRLSWSSALFGNSDRNNFKYRTLSDSIKRLEHALTSSGGIIQQVSYKINARQTLSAGLWLQSTDRQLPATLVMSSSDQRQVDQAFRSTIQWMQLSSKQLIQLKAAWFSESLHYTSPKSLSDELYLLSTLSAEAGYKRSGENTALEAGISYKILMANVPDYKTERTQQQAALFSSLVHKWESTGWKTVLNLRQEINDVYSIPFCPSIGTEGPILKNIRARASFSRNFRIPTMNDRFWQPGGNPDLKPESSWNQEIGLDWSIKGNSSKYQMDLGATVYNILIDNLILWEPVSTNFWTPRNIQQVWSRGVEASCKVSRQTGIINGYIRMSYTYSPSTYRHSSMSGDDAKGKQLIYIPLHKLNSMLMVNAGKFYGLMNCTWNGERFVQKDNRKSLPSYTLLNTSLGRNIALESLTGRLQVEVRNLLNTQFQAVQYYPEPGISVMLNLTITINQKNKK
jgi:vitamin B12 transporter